MRRTTNHPTPTRLPGRLHTRMQAQREALKNSKFDRRHLYLEREGFIRDDDSVNVPPADMAKRRRSTKERQVGPLYFFFLLHFQFLPLPIHPPTHPRPGRSLAHVACIAVGRSLAGWAGALHLLGVRTVPSSFIRVSAPGPHPALARLYAGPLEVALVFRVPHALECAQPGQAH
jgi:hypothetical protein